MSSHAARRSSSLGLKTQTHGDDKDVIAPPPAKRSDDILVVVRRKAFPSASPQITDPGDDKDVIAPTKA